MKRNWTYCILIIITSILLLGLNKLSDFRNKNIPSENTEAGAAKDCVIAAGQKIKKKKKGGRYYAFLPSGCQNEEAEVFSDIEPDSIVWMRSENIPAVFIDTESGTSELINTDKDVRETGHITVLEADGTVSFDYPLTYIKGRGNTSYTEFEKKPYQIKLPESVPFLGMPSAEKWVFISNSADPTLLRNALSRNLAGHLGLAQSEDGIFVDLYLNGEYVGNYYVTEKIEVKKNRLNITNLEKATKIVNNNEDFTLYETAWSDTTKAKQVPNEPDDISGGYLIERDFDDRFLKEIEEHGSYFITDAKESFILRSPEHASENQIAYIDAYIQGVENAILSPDGIDQNSGRYYTEFIDLDSFVRKYLLEEVTANYDGGVASSFFYKDIDAISDKLYVGPVWDYDVTWGNAPAYLGHISSSPNRLTRLAAHRDSSVWFSALYVKPEFYKELTACYADEISDYLPLLAEDVLPQLSEWTDASAEMDRVRWEDEYRLHEDIADRETEIAFLTEYILMRKEFLDKAWIEDIPVHQITLYTENTVYDTLYVFDGEYLPSFPEVDFDFARLVQWTSPDGSLPDVSAPVHGNMEFHAVLEYY